MSRSLELHELNASPNNMKVRVALGFKGLSYERRSHVFPDYPGDRADLVRLSGQPLTPVLVDGDRAIFDSGAILRYLEANFLDTPRLFSEEFGEMKAIEELEWFARLQLGEPVTEFFLAMFSPDIERAGRASSSKIHELTARIEERLGGSEFLIGDRLTAADVAAAPLVSHAMVSAAAAAENPAFGLFRTHLRLGPGRERTRAWVERVMAFDGARPFSLAVDGEPLPVGGGAGVAMPSNRG